MPIRVWNPNDFPIHLRSFDGDTIMIVGKAKGAQIANKFDWQIPSNMRVERLGDEDFCPTTIVPGRTLHPARKPPRSYNKSGQPIPENTMTAAQMREKAEQKKRNREMAAQLAAQARQQTTPRGE